VGEKTGKTLE